jgi:hypothetical protein
MFSLGSNVQITCADHVTKHRVEPSCRGMARADTLSQQGTMCAPGLDMVSVKRALRGLCPWQGFCTEGGTCRIPSRRCGVREATIRVVSTCGHPENRGEERWH